MADPDHDPIVDLAPFLEAARQSTPSDPPPDHLTARLIASRATSRQPAISPIPEFELPQSFGPYTLESILGRGATGTVYAAHDPELDRHIAVKILAPELATLPEARERFLREAQAAAALHHDHLMPVFAVHQDTPLPCLTMPLLEGQTLDAFLNQNGPITPNKLLPLATQITQALQAAHQAKIIHRDLKPSNIFLESSGPAPRIKLMDFGLARALDTPSQLTLSGTIAGTPEFLAPEQIDDDPNLTPATDLYALGATLYTLASGHPPFTGNSLTGLLKKVATDPPSPLTQLPEWLSQLILQLLSKSPANRPTSHQVLQALSSHQAPKPNTLHSKKKIFLVATLALCLIASLAFIFKPDPESTSFNLTTALATETQSILIPESGIYQLDPIQLDRPLDISADKPDTILHFTGTTPITTSHQLHLSNLTLRYDLPKNSPTKPLIVSSGPTVTLSNCRIEVSGREPDPLMQPPVINLLSPGTLSIENSAIFSFRNPLLQARSGGKLVLKNSLAIIPALIIAPESDDHHLQLNSTTANCLDLMVARPGSKPNHLVVNNSHLEVNHAFLWCPDTSLETLRETFIWTGQNNTLATTRLWHSTHPTKRRSRRPFPGDLNDFRDWQTLWPQSTDREVPPKLILLDLANTTTHPSELTLDTFQTEHSTGFTPSK